MNKNYILEEQTLKAFTIIHSPNSRGRGRGQGRERELKKIEMTIDFSKLMMIYFIAKVKAKRDNLISPS